MIKSRTCSPIASPACACASHAAVTAVVTARLALARCVPGSSLAPAVSAITSPFPPCAGTDLLRTGGVIMSAVRSQSDNKVRALLVGIDRYRVVGPLRGCANDTKHVGAFLRQRLDARLSMRCLLNEDATREAVVTAIRSHLGGALPGEVALLWFSGHGSQQPVAPEFWHLEPTGMSQSLVCHDSRALGVPDLTDKELSVLLDRVAERGVHTVVVLDCCHSGSGTRELGFRARAAPAATTVPSAAEYVPELRELVAGLRDQQVSGLTIAGRAQHVALSACQAHELAAERVVDGEPRGLFTASLLEALGQLGTHATYRDLLLAARCRIENVRAAQTPVLYPVHRDGLADQPIFGGAITSPESMTARWSIDRWLVDAGRCHGIPVSPSHIPVLMSVTHNADRVLRVVEVRAGESTVEPLGWKPDPAKRYGVALSRVPAPLAWVVVGGTVDDEPTVCARLTDAVNSSVHLRSAVGGDYAGGLQMRLAAVHRLGHAVLRILRPDGSPMAPDVRGHGEQSIRTVVAWMEHIARWTQLKELANPWSSLVGAVRMEIVLARPGITIAPQEDPPIPTEENGELTLTYDRTRDGWQPPQVFIRLRNTTNRRLWCVLLNLTDRYRSHASLFPGDFVGPMGMAAAAEGQRIPVVLPTGRPVGPGATSTDWCKLIVADREVNPTALELPALGEPTPRGRRSPSIAEFLGWEPTRDMTVANGVGDWTTSIVPVVTRVPHAHDHPRVALDDR
ncbi:caspase family protein [Micromonospora sp. NPDC048894]|uniref:caspase family protein n=1 Tax=Micromonospora sp. NPDC048894 TaxID=3155493 RepID=UPI0033D027EB